MGVNLYMVWNYKQANTVVIHKTLTPIRPELILQQEATVKSVRVRVRIPLPDRMPVNHRFPCAEQFWYPFPHPSKERRNGVQFFD